MFSGLTCAFVSSPQPEWKSILTMWLPWPAHNKFSMNDISKSSFTCSWAHGGQWGRIRPLSHSEKAQLVFTAPHVVESSRCHHRNAHTLGWSLKEKVESDQEPEEDLQVKNIKWVSMLIPIQKKKSRHLVYNSDLGKVSFPWIQDIFI